LTDDWPTEVDCIVSGLQRRKWKVDVDVEVAQFGTTNQRCMAQHKRRSCTRLALTRANSRAHNRTLFPSAHSSVCCFNLCVYPKRVLLTKLFAAPKLNAPIPIPTHIGAFARMPAHQSSHVDPLVICGCVADSSDLSRLSATQTQVQCIARRSRDHDGHFSTGMRRGSSIRQRSERDRDVRPGPWKSWDFRPRLPTGFTTITTSTSATDSGKCCRQLPSTTTAGFPLEDYR
jgi:hypothetical protein